MSSATTQERKLWIFQPNKLILFCLFILAEFDISRSGQKNVLVTSAMRLAVTLTDRKGWKSITEHESRAADGAVKDLILLIGKRESGMCNSIRKYILKLEAWSSRQTRFSSQTDDRCLITAGALTLAFRAFHLPNLEVNSGRTWEIQCAIEGYCIFLLTIPRLAQRLPLVLLPALKHKSVLSPCLLMMQASKEKFLKDISELDQPKIMTDMVMPEAAWILANIIYLAAASDKDGLDSGKFVDDLALRSYVCVVNFLTGHILAVVENAEGFGRENHETHADGNNLVDSDKMKFHGSKVTGDSLDASLIDFLKPVFQQHHLMGLLSLEKGDSGQMSGNLSQLHVVSSGKCELIDVSYYYSCMLRIFSALNPVLGPLPVLNMLSFTPGFLAKLWMSLEGSLFFFQR